MLPRIRSVALVTCLALWSSAHVFAATTRFPDYATSVGRSPNALQQRSACHMQDCSGFSVPECTIFREKILDVWRPVDNDVALKLCEKKCGPQLEEAKKHGQYSSYRCSPFQPEKWVDTDSGRTTHPRQMAAGNCSCNDPALLELGRVAVEEILPAVAEITCKAWFTAVKSVIEVGSMLIPGAGGAVVAAATTISQATEAIVYSIKDQKAQKELHQKYLQSKGEDKPPTSLMDTICGNKWTSDDAEKAFNTFQDVAGSLGGKSLVKAGKVPWAKGQGSVEDVWKLINGQKIPKKIEKTPELRKSPPRPSHIEPKKPPAPKTPPPSAHTTKKISFTTSLSLKTTTTTMPPRSTATTGSRMLPEKAIHRGI